MRKKDHLCPVPIRTHKNINTHRNTHTHTHTHIYIYRPCWSKSQCRRPIAHSQTKSDLDPHPIVAWHNKRGYLEQKSVDELTDTSQSKQPHTHTHTHTHTRTHTHTHHLTQLLGHVVVVGLLTAMLQKQRICNRGMEGIAEHCAHKERFRGTTRVATAFSVRQRHHAGEGRVAC